VGAREQPGVFAEPLILECGTRFAGWVEVCVARRAPPEKKEQAMSSFPVPMDRRHWMQCGRGSGGRFAIGLAGAARF
jgi:hypothetical protein